MVLFKRIFSLLILIVMLITFMGCTNVYDENIVLDLDSEENLFEDGQEISKGELISMHLYEENLGGLHLRFEIRCYKESDIGDEEYMGSVFTVQKIVPPFAPPSIAWLICER
jgi:hypothetical protein